MLHQLSERLTAAENYLRALQRGAARAYPLPEEILDRTLSQLGQAAQLLHQLRRGLDGSAPAGDGAGESFRVCFMNRFARGNKTVTVCQRSIVIPGAKSREAAIDAAKKRFAELEGIRDWHIHANDNRGGIARRQCGGGRSGNSRAAPRAATCQHGEERQVNSDQETRIRERAYTIWEAEGRPVGRHEDHWHRAAQELAQEDDAAASSQQVSRSGSRRTKRGAGR